MAQFIEQYKHLLLSFAPSYQLKSQTV